MEARRHKNEVIGVIGGEEYVLRFPMAAIAELCDRFGIAGMAEFGTHQFRQDDWPAIVAAGLRSHHPDLARVEWVESELHWRELPALVQACSRAIIGVDTSIVPPEGNAVAAEAAATPTASPSSGASGSDSADSVPTNSGTRPTESSPPSPEPTRRESKSATSSRPGSVHTSSPRGRGAR